MTKLLLLALAIAVFLVPKILGFFGIEGAPNDLNSWGRTMTETGISNIVAIVVLLVASFLLWKEYRIRKRYHPRYRALRSYFSPWSNTILSRIKFLDRGLVIKSIYRNWTEIEGGLSKNRSDIVTKGTMEIEGLGLSAVSQTLRPIKIKRCYFKSCENGQEIDASLNGQINWEEMTIKPGSVMTYFAKFDPKTNLSVPDFRSTWPSFEFILETEKFTQKILFKEELLEWLLYDAVTQLHAEPKRAMKIAS